MLSKFTVALMIWLLICTAGALAQESGLIPAELKPPAGEKLILQLKGRGDQVYICAADPARAQSFAWTLKEPDAKLYDTAGEQAGRHFAGPTWEAKDSSQVKGKAVAKHAAPKKDAIPWLLLTATGHTGDGVMHSVSSIQRVNTGGGQPPAEGCDASHTGAEKRVPYTADYRFYAR